MGITKVHGLAVLVTAGITGAIWYHPPVSPASAQEATASSTEGTADMTNMNQSFCQLPRQTDLTETSPMLPRILYPQPLLTKPHTGSLTTSDAHRRTSADGQKSAQRNAWVLVYKM
ncbi:uncharacterized protein [Melanerpes formicivorus]|uniref:uncharacterized protein isoform X3 n=1 Tax=Melanerpes formicivorus TaxID=211600 RepID=UPI00358F9632